MSTASPSGKRGACAYGFLSSVTSLYNLTRRMDARWRSRLRFGPLVLATALLAWRTIAAVLAKVGRPGPTLDDAYIHFQYARAFAEGHPFRFQAGEPISTGATSFLWPAVLAPFYAIGFRGPAIMWPAWALSYLALGLLAYEAARLTEPLAGRGPAIGAAAMVLAFGGHAWCAASGMEVLPFAWLLAATLRQVAEWDEGTPRPRALLALAIAAPLMRPEGSLVTVAAAVVVALRPRGHRRLAIALAGAAVLPTLVLFLLTGKATSSTAQVKLLFGNPYYSVLDGSLANARVLVGTILDGQVWSAEFLPSGGAPIACLGLGAIALRAWQTRRLVRGGVVLLLALAMFVPCTYVTFLWNRLRYLWPFATGWLVGLACLARVVGSLVHRLDPRAGVAATTLVAGAFAGALLVRLEWVLEDVAQSASGIDRQQAALGRWAHAELPSTARIGVNDTGAIAYYGERKTFDVVGLTTPTEGKYWVAGAASRFEHYERMDRTALPTHFIVYPEWLGLEPVLGRALREAVVTDSTILGGQLMRASEARWDLLGTGERPWTKCGAIVDALDVADLESEAAHGYVLGPAREGDQIVDEGNDPNGNVVADGGRTHRLRDAFTVMLPPDKELVGIARLDVPAETEVDITVGGRSTRIHLAPGPWQEVVFDVPPSPRGNVDVEVTAAGFTSFHYWFGER
jgi:hypothetical protein